MSDCAPIHAFWDGEVFRPESPYWQRRADKRFAKGEVLRLTHNPERSTSSHQHLFAAIDEAFANLPPLLAERFTSPEALRKYCLIKAGHCFSESITCPSHADALRVCRFVQGADAFALVTVNKSVVTRFWAKSIAYRALDKKDFQTVKDNVLRVLSEMIGVAKQELSDAGKAA